MKYFFLSLLLIMARFASAQAISASVIGLAGGYAKTPGGSSVSWTVGEVIVDPVRSEDILLTQGFQQPRLKVATGYQDHMFEYNLKVFPNPATSVLRMESDFPESIDFRLVDINGSLIYHDSWTTEYNLNVTDLTPGTYAIYYITEGRIVKSELISKH